MDLDWCIRCDKHTKGGLYCSESCQLEDYAQNSRANRAADPLGIPRRATSTSMVSPTQGPSSAHNEGQQWPPSQYNGVTIVNGLATPSSSPEYLMPKQLPYQPMQRRTASQPHSFMASNAQTRPAAHLPTIPTCATTAAAMLRQKILGYGQDSGALDTTQPQYPRPAPAQRSTSSSNIRSTSTFLNGYVPSL
ncbi:hypothetical protein BDF19DRAFT_413936 [Syncephalis fuscata]|nr:hypothetical protein BDF19DRAFT_413936 [Syncephalis fuscata]